MTHDETTAALRGPQVVRVFDPEELHEIANRLDLYRDLLERSMPYIDAVERSKADALFVEIRTAIAERRA